MRSGGSSRWMTTICERGTITSRTWISDTCSTPSSIANTSVSMSPRSRASVRTSEQLLEVLRLSRE